MAQVSGIFEESRFRVWLGRDGGIHLDIEREDCALGFQVGLDAIPTQQIVPILDSTCQKLTHYVYKLSLDAHILVVNQNLLAIA